MDAYNLKRLELLNVKDNLKNEKLELKIKMTRESKTKMLKKEVKINF